MGQNRADVLHFRLGVLGCLGRVGEGRLVALGRLLQGALQILERARQSAGGLPGLLLHLT